MTINIGTEPIFRDIANAEWLKQEKQRIAENEAYFKSLQVQSEEEYQRRVRAVIETGLAYYRKGARIQYDAAELVISNSRFDGIGSRRASNYISPEDATWDMIQYTVCSTLPFNLYHDVLGAYLELDPDYCRCCEQLALEDRSYVYHWKENCGTSREDAVDTVRKILRPGDVLIGHKYLGGHAMLYMGDCLGDGTDYLLHSWGGKYNMETGADWYEPEGTMLLQPAEVLCFEKTDTPVQECTAIKRFCLYENTYEIGILRPLWTHTEATHPLTPNAEARLAHPGLSIERTASIKPYATLAKGGKITYKIEVENHSEISYTDIEVTERIAEGTELTDCGGATVKDGKLYWTLTVPAGGSAEVQYTLTEKNSGGWIVSDGGSVAGIRSNCIKTHVGNILTSEEAALLLKHAEEGFEPAYRALGIEVSLEKLADRLVEPVPGYDGLVRMHRTPEMLIPGFIGGKRLVTASIKDRILEFDIDRLHIGDILLRVPDLSAEDAELLTYLYIGEGKYLLQTKEGMKTIEEDVLWKLFIDDLFFCFRPSFTKNR